MKSRAIYVALKKLFLKVIDVIIRVVANHKGFMAFRLCPNNNPTKAPPAECFSQHPLKLANGETFYFLEPQLKMPGAEERVELKLKLPDELQCWQCIIQWTYVAGMLLQHSFFRYISNRDTMVAESQAPT